MIGGAIINTQRKLASSKNAEIDPRIFIPGYQPAQLTQEQSRAKIFGLFGGTPRG